MTPAAPDSVAQRGSDPHQRACFDDALDCVITIDDRGLVTYFNNAAEETFGCRSSEAVGRELADLIVPPSNREAHRRGLTRYLGTGKSSILGRRIELTAMRADQTEFPVELTVTRAEPPAGGGFVGFVRDITERVRAEEELRSAHRSVELIANEQAALRRVATLVARGVAPDEIFSAVTNEVGQLFGSDQTAIGRYERDGSGVVWVGLSQGLLRTVPIGTRWPLEDFLVSTTVYRTGRPARQEERGYETASGPVVDTLRELNIVSRVAAPIVVEGNLWGVMTVSDRRERLPVEAEERVAKFTELLGTAVANAESQAALATSEARAHNLAREQAALRRVATLVAEGPSADHLFSAVAEEVSNVLDIPVVSLNRFEAHGTFTMMGVAGDTGFTVGSRWPVTDDGLAGVILATRRPARKEDYAAVAGSLGAAVRDDRLISTVGVPIIVESDIWGFIAGGARPGKPIPDDTEERLARFTELVATAIADSQSRSELAASEARARELANEQAALRRVATLVARSAEAQEVFSAVAGEVARVFDVEKLTVCRYEPDAILVLSSFGAPEFPSGTRWPLDVPSLPALIRDTGRPARIDNLTDAAGLNAIARDAGVTAAVAVPIVVAGDIWGSINIARTKNQRFGPDAEERLARFTGLVATAVSNATMREELAASEARARDLAREQAALRRVATLVAKEAAPDAVFSAVSREIEDLLDIDVVTLCRHEPDGFLLVSSRGMPGFPAGSRWPRDAPSLPGLIYQAGRPVRIDDFADAEGLNAVARDAGVRAAVGVPILVGRSVWGSVCAASTKNEPFPLGTEESLARFTELVATSVSNAVMREELAASRARVIAAADDARRRIERDLHDGAQQRLVTLAVALRRAEARLPSGSDELGADVSRVAEGLITAVDELRELSQGIHPAELTEGGLSPALKALGRRSAARVELDVPFENRLPDRVEVAAYYTVSEALTNASKHSGAGCVRVSLHLGDDALELSIRDDGIGGADASAGSGLTGLRDRIEALGGTLQIDSPRGRGTRLEAEIPICQSADRRGEPSERPSPVAGPGPLR